MSNTNIIAVPADAQAVIIFTPGQLLLRHRVTNGYSPRPTSLEDTWETKPVSHDTLALAWSEIRIDSGWIPPNVIRHGRDQGNEWALLFVPPAVQLLAIHTYQENKTIAETLTPPLPALLFFGIGQSYFIRAVKCNGFDPKTETYHAPFSNLADDGRICYGTNHIPPCTPQTIHKAWEEFVRSPFTPGTRDKMDLLWELSNRQRKTFPVKKLKPAEHNIESWLKRVFKGKGEE